MECQGLDLNGIHAPREDVVTELHGQRINDPYRWLEDPASQRTVAWSAAQERAFAAARADWPDLAGWREHITALSMTNKVTVPVARGRRMFVIRQAAQAEHPILGVIEDGIERVLLSPHELDPSGRTTLERWMPSAEGDLICFQLSCAGTEDSLLRVLDVSSGAIVDGPIDRVRRSSIGWLPGGEAFYYVRRLPPELHPGEERYHRRVYLHQVGSDPADDAEVFGAGRESTQFYRVAVTPGGRWLTITTSVGADRATNVYLADLSLSGPDRPEFVAVHEGRSSRVLAHIATGTGPADTIWLHTDLDAPRGRIVACTPAEAAQPTWRELIAERHDAVLEGLAILGGPELDRPLGLVSWTRHALVEITVHDLTDGRQVSTVPLPGPGSVSELSVRPEGGHEAWLVYTDYATPPTLLRYDARTGQTSFSPLAAETNRRVEARTEHVTFTSKDGTQVGMFVVSANGRADRPRPAILTGYGGFGRSMAPRYSPVALAWVRSGGVFAEACLRGGGEEGEQWHLAGRGQHKQNVFDDFDAAGDYLIKAGWTSREQLAIMGGSNGGLLVGAAITQHAEKYAAAVCRAPLLDMVRYELSGLGPTWRREYGSADDPAQLRTLLSYSPYHRVTPGTAYPPVLLTAGDGDTRVDPLHARKMCAALQYATSSNGPVLLRLERGVGHGIRAASLEIDLASDCLAFLGHHLRLRSAMEQP